MIAALAIGPVAAARAEKFATPTILDGACTQSSHTAEGMRGEDLTKRQSRFSCNSVVIMNPNNDPSRVLMTFATKGSDSALNSMIGFAGDFDGPDMIQVRRIYIEGGQAQTVDDGACKIFRKNGQISGFSCGAMVDKAKRRIVRIVGFDVKPTVAPAATAGSISTGKGEPINYPRYRQSGVATCTCPGTNIEFVMDGQGSARIARTSSNYVGFTKATRVREWAVYRTVKEERTLIVFDNGQQSRIMADPDTQKAMGFLADGGVSDMLCQIMVKAN
ncbi:hypothetical protein [Methylobacterium sp. E-046]|uniref:hypothetical protein n=1 Tax=Methylobacterium sp. E-046 TaxID=2836576 RepID=UPI001FBA24A6|nr:hypothetical protein [Methylobacterium sp. E-046]MCJ2099465.1 hypothetical protein [Methylobacterium sp. E-046]